MMTKGYEASKECFLRRRVFIIKESSEKEDVKKKGLPYGVSITV